MNEVNYPAPEPRGIVYYHITENNKHAIHVKLYELDQTTILIYAFGTISDDYVNWKWKSEKINLIHNEFKITFRDELENENDIIKGYIPINEYGEVLEKDFSPVCLGFGGIRMTSIDESDTQQVFKLKPITIDDLPQVPVKTEFYEYGDITVKQRISDFIKTKSIGNKVIKIFNPFMSSSLISLIKNALPGDLEIQILTYKINRNEYNAIQNEINSISSQIEISIKVLNVRGKILDIHQSTRIPNPFHDRFIISGGVVLIIGTSLNSIITNSTFINQMSNFKAVEQNFDEWFSGIDIPYSGNILYFEDFVI